MQDSELSILDERRKGNTYWYKHIISSNTLTRYFNSSRPIKIYTQHFVLCCIQLLLFSSSFVDWLTFLFYFRFRFIFIMGSTKGCSIAILFVTSIVEDRSILWFISKLIILTSVDNGEAHREKKIFAPNIYGANGFLCYSNMNKFVFWSNVSNFGQWLFISSVCWFTTAKPMYCFKPQSAWWSSFKVNVWLNFTIQKKHIVFESTHILLKSAPQTL